MNNFSYENQGANTFLVYSVGESENVDPVSLGMLTNNKIPGMSKVLFMQMDNSKILKYNISAKMTLKQYFSGNVNKAKFLSVCSSIIETVLSAEDYMIDIKTIIMDENYIFVDSRTGELNLICVPLMDSVSVYKNPIDLFKNIMFGTNFDQTENCDYVAKVINYVNSTSLFSYANFKILIESLYSGSHSFTPAQPAQVHAKENRSTVQQTPETPVVTKQPTVPQNKTVNNAVTTPVQHNVSNEHAPDNEVSDSPAPNEKSGEKEITMLQLLMHYNKENAEKYKAQKSSKQSKGEEKNKTKSAVAGSPFSVPGKASPAKQNKKSQSESMKSVGFEIPGQKPSMTSSGVSTSTNVQESTPKTIVQEKSSAMSSMPVYQTQSAPKELNMNFGETMVLDGGMYGETTLLNETTVLNQYQNPPVTAYIIRSKNNEKVCVNKPVFRIGKERSYVDYFIGDNTAISRSHANIISRDGEFYIVDTNSTNHTYVNGLMLQNNVETKLTNGSKLRLANEDFEFKIM